MMFPLGLLFGDRVDLQVMRPCLCSQEWTDYRLAWNSSYYEGVNILRIPAKRVWLPDIVLYNK